MRSSDKNLPNDLNGLEIEVNVPMGRTPFIMTTFLDFDYDTGEY